MNTRYLVASAAIAGMALTTSALAAGWNVSATAGPADNSRGGLRIVRAAISDQDGKPVRGLNATSFAAFVYVCATQQCGFKDTGLGAPDVPAVSEERPGLYLVAVQKASSGAPIALQVMPKFNPRAIVPGSPPPTPIEERAQRQMAFVVVP